MTAQQYDARGCVFQIEDPDNAGTWVDIHGVDTFTKGHDSSTTETTTYASDGEYEGQVMQRGKTMKLAGKRYKDPDTSALDPGQGLVETLGQRKSDASLGGFRFAHEADTEWEVWTAYVVLDDQGGGNNDKVSWGASFTRSGASTTAARS